MSSENDLTPCRNKSGPNPKYVGVPQYVPIDSEDGENANLLRLPKHQSQSSYS
jgi:hypothetical protein